MLSIFRKVRIQTLINGRRLTTSLTEAGLSVNDSHELLKSMILAETKPKEKKKKKANFICSENGKQLFP